MCIVDVDCKIEPDRSDHQNMDWGLDQQSDIKVDEDEHVKSVNEEVNYLYYSCDLCKYKATKKAHLKKYEESVHGGNK